MVPYIGIAFENVSPCSICKSRFADSQQIHEIALSRCADSKLRAFENIFRGEIERYCVAYSLASGSVGFMERQ
jgi:hypothetical protein